MVKHGSVRGKARTGTPVWTHAAKPGLEKEMWSRFTSILLVNQNLETGVCYPVCL